MRTMITTVAAGAAMMLMTMGAGFAAPISNPQLNGVAAFESGVTHVQWEHCEHLRRACEYGERGEGNCRRYREECGERAHYCERLRHACEFGERGEGNCRRYREECGGHR